jgi:hypothetical protein
MLVQPVIGFAPRVAPGSGSSPKRVAGWLRPPLRKQS